MSWITKRVCALCCLARLPAPRPAFHLPVCRTAQLGLADSVLSLPSPPCLPSALCLPSPPLPSSLVPPLSSCSLVHVHGHSDPHAMGHVALLTCSSHRPCWKGGGLYFLAKAVLPYTQDWVNSRKFTASKQGRPIIPSVLPAQVSAMDLVQIRIPSKSVSSESMVARLWVEMGVAVVGHRGLIACIKNKELSPHTLLPPAAFCSML